MVTNVKNLSTTYDCKSAGTPNGLEYLLNVWASPPGARGNASPPGVPADLKSADKKGSTTLMRI